jgi:hypothetical protein
VPVLPHEVLSQGMTLSITVAVAVVYTALANSVPVQHDFYVATVSFSFLILQKSLWSTSYANTEKNRYLMLVNISTTIRMSLADCARVVGTSGQTGRRWKAEGANGEFNQ